MKLISVICITIAMCTLCPSQQIMDDAAKTKVIQNLEELLNANLSKETKVIQTAISKLSSAGKDPSAAYELLVQSKKILMENEKEKTSGSRNSKQAKNAGNSLKDWMEREAKKYQDRHARKGLMLQYQWGVLVLKARLKEKLQNPSLDERDNTAISLTEFQSQVAAILKMYVDACQDPEFVNPSAKDGPKRAGMQIAEESVFDTEVGEALGISSMASKHFPNSLKNRDDIFEKLFLKEYRQTRNVKQLRTTWEKRIALEVALFKIKHIIDSGKKSGIQGRINSTRDSELNEQSLAALDQLRWRCEMDCFELGEQLTATNNMVKLIKNTIDPVRRDANIRSLREKLILSMQKTTPDSELEGKVTASQQKESNPATLISKGKASPKGSDDTADTNTQENDFFDDI